MTKSEMDKSMRPGCRYKDLDPLMLMMDNLRRAKLRRHCRSPITELYDVACFSTRRPPSLFKVTVAQGPIEGGVFNLSYSLFIDFSLILLVAPVA